MAQLNQILGQNFNLLPLFRVVCAGKGILFCAEGHEDVYTHAAF